MFIDIKVAYITAVLIGTVKAWTDYLTFDSCDNKPIYRVNDGKSYTVSFNGNNVDDKCKFGFHAYDSDHTLNQYKICIQATFWNIQNNNMDLYYYTESGDAAKIFTYDSTGDGSPTKEWCSESNQYVAIELVTYGSQYLGMFTLDVKGVKTSDYYNTIGWIMGGAVGVVAILVLLVIIQIIMVCKRKRVPMEGVTYGPGTIITQSGSQQIRGGFANPNHGYITDQPPPPYYVATNNTNNVQEQRNRQQEASYQQYSGSLGTQQTVVETRQTSETEQTTVETNEQTAVQE